MRQDWGSSWRWYHEAGSWFEAAEAGRSGRGNEGGAGLVSEWTVAV